MVDFFPDEVANNNSVLFNRQKFKDLYQLIFVGCGEQDERLYSGNAEAMKLLKEEYELPITFFHIPGEHNWTFWRKALRAFLNLVFK